MKKVLIAMAALTMFVACTKKEQPAPTNEAPVQQEQAAAPTEPAAAASPEAPAAQ